MQPVLAKTLCNSLTDTEASIINSIIGTFSELLGFEPTEKTVAVSKDETRIRCKFDNQHGAQCSCELPLEKK